MKIFKIEDNIIKLSTKKLHKFGPYSCQYFCSSYVCVFCFWVNRLHNKRVLLYGVIYTHWNIKEVKWMKEDKPAHPHAMWINKSFCKNRLKSVYIFSEYFRIHFHLTCYLLYYISKYTACEHSLHTFK